LFSAATVLRIRAKSEAAKTLYTEAAGAVQSVVVGDDEAV